MKNIVSQFNILDNYTLNDEKGYACDVSILTSDCDSLRTHRARLKESRITENVKEWSTPEIISSNRNRGHHTTRFNFTTPMYDDKINSNQQRIQQKYDCRELQCTGKMHNADYNKEYKEQSRENFGFFYRCG